jgi:branched-chain amino acid transport system permease protein
VRGLAFFFGLAFIIEVALILGFGVDQRTVQAAYIGSSLELGDYRRPVPHAGRLRRGPRLDFFS